MPRSDLFTRLASRIAHGAGRPLTFVACCALVLLWALSGPLFGYSDTWQLVINTSTTIITFLMVFLIQNTQNRDSVAIQAKLDELIRVTEKARNMMIGIEHLTEDQIDAILRECEEAAGDTTAADADRTEGRRKRKAAREGPPVKSA